MDDLVPDNASYGSGIEAASSSPSPSLSGSANATISVLVVSTLTKASAPDVSVITSAVEAPLYDNSTITTSKRVSNASCTVNVPSANVGFWYPATYSYPLGTMTTAAANFSNSESYTLVPQTTPFDAASALETDYACTASYSYVPEWDWTYSFCIEYTEKPTAAATSIAYRTAAAAFPADGVIPVTDARFYDLYGIDLPSATATISVAPNITQTLTSATPFVYFTAYEVESGNKTETIQLPSAYVYPYWLKGVEREATADGPLPKSFLEQLPQSNCDSGRLQATVTVVIVVDLYYENRPIANPFIIHYESTVLGFDDEPVTANDQGSSRLVPLTIADWDLPGLTVKPTPKAASVTQTSSNVAAKPISQSPQLPRPTRVTVGTIGTFPVVIGPSSQVIVGSQILQPGGSPVTVGAGTLVFLAPSATAIVVGSITSQLPQVLNPPTHPSAQPPPILTVGSLTLTPNAATQFFIAPGQTLTPGGVVAVDGTVVSLAPSASFVVIGGSTQILPTANPGSDPVPTERPQIIVGGSTFIAQPTRGVNGIPDTSNDNPGNSNNLGPAPTFVISGQTLAPGGSAITVSGTTLSLAPSGSVVLINGITSTLENVAAAQITPPPLTIGNEVFRPLPGTGSAYIIGSMLLTPGGSVVTDHTTISLSPGGTALVINGQTSLIASQPPPAITNPPLLTIGPQAYTAVSGTTFVISGQTLTPGGTITVDGTTIILAPGATELIYGSSGRSTSTALFPATTTRSESVASTSSPSAGLSGSNGQATATTSREGAAPKLHVGSWVLISVITVLGLFLT